MKTLRKIRGSAMVQILVLIAMTVAPIWAGGQGETEAPQLSVPPQPRQYLSPNGDGDLDELELPFSEVVVPGEDRVIVEYNLSVFNGEGQVVFSVSDRQTETLGFFGRVFGGEAPKVSIPDSLTWDGTYRIPDGEPTPDGAVDGEVVPDGEYTYQLAVIDDAGGFARSAPFNVTVDTEAPTVTRFVEPQYTVFSPNDDGIRDTVLIETEGSREPQWTLRIVNTEGSTVYERTVENETPRRVQNDPTPPSDFEWDGVANTGDQQGNLVAEGLYTLQLEGTDRAGNTTTAESPFQIELNLAAAELSLEIGDGNPRFSPNGDGVRDVIEVASNVRGTAQVVEWRLDLLRGDRVLRSWNDFGSVPDVFEIDGRLDERTPLPDGEYNLMLWGRFENGNQVESPSLSIIVDTRPPRVEMSAGTRPEQTELGRPMVFGGAAKSTLQVSVTLETSVAGIEWTAELKRDGNLVGQAQLSDLAAIMPNGIDDGKIQFEWDGSVPPSLRDAFGSRTAPDGTYELIMRGQDVAGNTTVSSPLRAIKDTRRPPVGLSIEGEFLSPLSDSEYSSVTVRTDVPQTERIDEFLLEIRDARNRVVRSEYKRQVFNSFEWRGLTNGGTIVPDGVYTAHLAAVYQNGHTAQADADAQVVVDRTAPRIERLTSEYRRFSPDGDGERDTVTIDQRVVPGDTWRARILNRNDEVVVEQTYEGQVENFVWDGTNRLGQIVPDGDYRYVLSGHDDAGNRTVEDLDLVVDTTVELPAPLVELDVSPRTFTPDGDGMDDTVTMTIDVETESPATEWRVEIRGEDDRLWKAYSGSGEPPATLQWDGRSEQGMAAPANSTQTVHATVVAENDKAGRAEVKVQIGRLRTLEAPQLSLAVRPSEFTPDDDGVNDMATISVDVESFSPVVSWTVEIRDADDRVWKRFVGTGTPPNQLTWDGWSAAGNRIPGNATYVVEGAVVAQNQKIGTDQARLTAGQLRTDVKPQVTLRISPQPFTPDNDGVAERAAIQPVVRSVNPIEQWEIVIHDPRDNILRTYEGDGDPPHLIVWDGTGDNGRLVEAATTYPVTMTVTDSYGNQAETETSVEVGILIIREGERLRIRISSIYFPPNSPDLFEGTEAQLKGNLETLRRLAEILNSYPERHVIVEGHAAHVYLDDPEKFEWEERVELKPLSEDRAREVMQALIILGVEAERLESVGYGGTRPVVPFEDLESLWRNRRVEFVLEK